MMMAACWKQALRLCALLVLLRPSSGSSQVLTAVNITWLSINFKTILQWEPKPTNYVYTVEIEGGKLRPTKKCIQIADTECDVTNLLENVRDTYTARIESISKMGDDNPPYASSTFTPYSQTTIGIPKIKNYTQNEETLTVVVEDPLTPYRFQNGSLQTIRDIFKNDLEYTLYYWKDQSTGKKESKTKGNQFEVSIDQGNNYCFHVQATIISRSQNRRSEPSADICTNVSTGSSDEFEMELILVIAGAAVGALLLIIFVSVVVYKCTRAKATAKGKESVPLNT